MAQVQAPKKPAAKASMAAPKRQPDYVIRVNVNGFWQNAGAVWSAALKDGIVGYSMKMTMIPAGWTGDALLMPPLPPKDGEGA